MSDDYSDESARAERGNEREDVDGVPAGPEDDVVPGASEHPEGIRGNRERFVGLDRADHPALDEALLAELIDEDDTAEQRARKVAVISQQVAKAYSGPLPQADEFERYKEVDPSAPRIILGMAKDANTAMTNRVNAEAEAIRANARIDEKAVPRGQIISGALIFGVLVLAGIALFLDRSWFVFLFGAGGLGIMAMNTLPSILNRNNQASPASGEENLPSVDK